MVNWRDWELGFSNTMVIRKYETIKYKVFALRLHEETKKKLIDKHKRSGLSWNLFIITLLKQNGG